MHKLFSRPQYKQTIPGFGSATVFAIGVRGRAIEAYSLILFP
ncbi:hypothetical protein XSR1_120049 [Xenorhabdus szentirmaii DSM 16338]|uniref:Uncharacterized protein n=1 Tax=Xenorhabdus szentirmaii DSM 16338 TaxID=1427518 RepID=W1IS59_9GAMM|nr:hypothetical protein XSR1_120049 [Xenorhabdus szentirmaii DSM 16338]